MEAEPIEAVPDDAGTAGSSARREYERRKAKDEERLRQKWGKLGGIAVALSDEKQSTKAWATGAVGEERLGARLDSLVSESIAVLHDRRIPGSKANIDHIAITAGRHLGDRREAVQGSSRVEDRRRHPAARRSRRSSSVGATAPSSSTAYSSKSTWCARSSATSQSSARSASSRPTGR
ncbi:MAG: nuclease-related domain-containing protein [Marmoricola sp.]